MIADPTSAKPISRQTFIAAADILKSLGHTGFDRLLLEFSLPDKNAGRDSAPFYLTIIRRCREKS
jgi:hypothetical protein